jgi:hypothetical protein
METTIKNQSKAVKWIKKIGLWGFLFFLVKGLIWLVIGIIGFNAVN